MLYLRSLLFNILAYSLLGIGCIINTVIGLISREATIASWNYVFLPTFKLLMKYVVGMEIEIRGTENIKQSGVIYAGKHESAVETYVLTTFIKRATLVMKKELTYIPLFGWAQAVYGLIPINRSAGTKAMKEMLTKAKKMIKANRPIIIFPEGTRRKPEAEPVYKPGVALLYQQLNLPVVPIASNTGFFWAKSSFLRHKGKIIFEFLPAIEPGLNKKEFMQKLENTIENKCHELNMETIKNFPELKKMTA